MSSSLQTLPEAAEKAAEGTSVTVRVLRSFEDAEAFRAAWNELVLKSGADVYQTFEWCRAWWNHYGKRRSAHLLLFSSGENLVGIVPAFTETLWLGPARIRAAKLMGSDFSLQFCNLPVLPEVLDETVSHALRYFLGEQRCDVFVTGPLSGPSARVDEILAAGRAETNLVETAEALGNSISTRFDLPDEHAQYLELIGSRQRGNYNRSVKQLEKNHKVLTDTVSDADDVLREFDNFQVLHEAQWSAEGKLGHFGDWPRAAEFNRELVKELGKQDIVRFFRIHADGVVASSQFCFVFGGTNYWRLPGRECRAEWEKLSLGKMGLIQMIEASMSEGVRAIEGGRGHYDYKLQLGGKEWPLRTIQFTRKGFGVSIRVRLFMALAKLLNIAYYKILFVRLAPRFPVLKGSLWPVWIRSTW